MSQPIPPASGAPTNVQVPNSVTATGLAQVLTQLPYVVPRLTEVGVVVDADHVEQVPVDHVVLGGGVAEAAVEDRAAHLGRPRGEAVQLALRPHRVEVALHPVLHALQDRVPRQDARHEQPELAAHAELDARTLPAQPLREPAALGEMVEDVPPRDVPEGRLEPDVQPAFGGLGGGGGEAFDTVAGDVEGVGVQLVADGADVGAHAGGVPRGGGGLALADGVDDAVAGESAPSSLRVGPSRGQQRRGPRGSDPGKNLSRFDPFFLPHAPLVSPADGSARPPMVYGGATKG